MAFWTVAELFRLQEEGRILYYIIIIAFRRRRLFSSVNLTAKRISTAVTTAAIIIISSRVYYTRFPLSIFFFFFFLFCSFFLFVRLSVVVHERIPVYNKIIYRGEKNPIRSRSCDNVRKLEKYIKKPINLLRLHGAAAAAAAASAALYYIEFISLLYTSGR